MACVSPFGPDVSHYQGHVDWNAVKKAGAGFGIAKATEGLSYVDNQFKVNWQGMKSAGLRVRGAYHFGHPKEDAKKQAAHFVSTVGKLSAGDFVALDIESASTGMNDELSPSAVAQWCGQFVSHVQSGLGVAPQRVVVYTGAWFWNPQAGGGAGLPSSFFSQHPLWVSGYVPSSPPMPKGWKHWTLWQYTDKLKLQGVSGGVDASRFSGTQSQLEQLFGH